MALGFSHTPIMALTSNIECIRDTPETFAAFTSWMSPPRAVTRSGVDQTIIRFVEGRLIGNRIYCRIERDSFSIVNDHIFDLENEKYYLLIAGGIELRENSVGRHGPNRGVSAEPVSLLTLYDGCGRFKVCHGVPEGCIAARNCELFGSITHDGENFDFELMSIREFY